MWRLRAIITPVCALETLMERQFALGREIYWLGFSPRHVDHRKNQKLEKGGRGSMSSESISGEKRFHTRVCVYILDISNISSVTLHSQDIQPVCWWCVNAPRVNNARNNISSSHMALAGRECVVCHCIDGKQAVGIYNIIRACICRNLIRHR